MAPKWTPVVTADSIENKGTYEYGASVVGGRLFCCAGLGTDTLVSVTLDGRNSGKPWTMPGKLTADPAALKVFGGFAVFFTVGEPDGKRNGISSVIMNDNGIVTSEVRVVVPQSENPNTYGVGQPSVASGPDGLLLACRTDREGGGDQIRFYRFKGAQVLAEVPTAEVEDGASPEIFFIDGKLHMLIAGGGYVGIRTYEMISGTLRRERELEAQFPLPSGGAFHARTAVFFADTIDGVGIVRDASNKPIVQAARAITFWRAAGKAADPGTWGLRRGEITLP